MGIKRKIGFIPSELDNRVGITAINLNIPQNFSETDNTEDDFLTDPALDIPTVDDIAIVVPETLNIVLYYLVLTYETETSYTRNEEPTKLRNTSGFQTEIEARAYIIREMRTDRYPRKYVLHIVTATDVVDIQSTSGN